MGSGRVDWREYVSVQLSAERHFIGNTSRSVTKSADLLRKVASAMTNDFHALIDQSHTVQEFGYKRLRAFMEVLQTKKAIKTGCPPRIKFDPERSLQSENMCFTIATVGMNPNEFAEIVMSNIAEANKVGLWNLKAPLWTMKAANGQLSLHTDIPWLPPKIIITIGIEVELKHGEQ